MSAKIPDDAFEMYYAQGANRSYQALADELGVSKRAVTQKAAKEDWQGRIAVREQRTRDAVAARVEATIEDLNTRHLKLMRAVQAKALEALKALPLDSAMNAVRALDIAVR